MKRRQMQILYAGHVQGVGFRYATKSVARGFEVTGIVRNLDDGRVELIAEGAREELEAFQRAVQDSEVGRFIRKEMVLWSEVKNEFRGFEIVK
ncbi:MAG: acylphosphatase [Verrucomicrobiota bacterium]